MRTYRPCVLAVFINNEAKVLVGKRSDNGAWQFPQGGIDPGESELSALFREMQEEIGCDHFKVIKKIDNLLRYDFPKDATFSLTKNYLGQNQRWFLCQFNQDQAPCLDKASSFEFQELAWVSIDFVLQEVVSWKRELYQKGLFLLGLKKHP